MSGVSCPFPSPLRFLTATSLLLCAQAQALDMRQMTAAGMLYTVATVDPGRDKLRLYWKDRQGQPFRTFDAVQAEVARQGSAVLFATNSGIYAAGPRPLGLHVEQGRTLTALNNAKSGGNFALLPNGVFWIQGTRAGVTETGAYRRLNLTPTYATQSGPLLVQAGRLHPAFNKGSTSFKLRSGVGVCRDGRVRFAVSAGPVNFYAFALFFRDTLKCPDALYLDGSISAYATPGRNTQLAEFAGIWAVVR